MIFLTTGSVRREVSVTVYGKIHLYIHWTRAFIDCGAAVMIPYDLMRRKSILPTAQDLEDSGNP